MLKTEKAQKMNERITNYYDGLYDTVQNGENYTMEKELMDSCDICNGIETFCEDKPILSLIMMLYCKYSESSEAIKAIAEELNLDPEYIETEIKNFYMDLKEAAEKTSNSNSYVKKIC